MNPLDRLVQALKKRATQAVGNIKGNIKAVSNPQTRSTWVKPFTPSTLINNLAVKSAGPRFANWTQDLARDTKKRGIVQGMQDLSNPILMNPKVYPMAEPIVSGMRVANYKLKKNIPGIINKYIQNYQKAAPYVPFAPKTPQIKTAKPNYGQLKNIDPFSTSAGGFVEGVAEATRKRPGSTLTPGGFLYEGGKGTIKNITSPNPKFFSEVIEKKIPGFAGSTIGLAGEFALPGVVPTAEAKTAKTLIKKLLTKSATGAAVGGLYSGAIGASKAKDSKELPGKFIESAKPGVAIGALLGGATSFMPSKATGAKVKGFELYKTDLEDIRNNFKLAKQIENIKPGQKLDLEQYKVLEDTSNLFKKSYKIPVEEKVWKKMSLTERYNAILSKAAEKYRSGAQMNLVAKPLVEGGVKQIDIKPKTTLLKKISNLEQKAQKDIMEQKEVAQTKLAQIDQLSGDDLKDITSLRRMATSKIGQEGDITTLYKKNPKLVGKVLNRMREITADYQTNANRTDDELLEMALNLPTKSETRIKRPIVLDKVKELKEQAKRVQDLAYNSELDPNLKTALIKKNEKLLKQNAEREYKEWQNMVFKQTVAQEKTTTKKSLETVLGGIKKSYSPLSDIEEMTDISGFNAGMRDLSRNFKQAFGKRFGEAKRLVLDPFDKAKGDLFTEYNALASKLENNIVKKLGIEKGSDISAQVQRYGEGTIKPDEWAKITPQNQKKIVEADKWFRNEYDRLLGEVNDIRKRIYPNDPTKIIPKRNDYYRHFREMAQGFQGLLNIFETPAGISSTLSGVSEFTTPRSKWLSFAQKRRGPITDEDAVGGFVDYIKSAGYAKHIDPQISKFRNLAGELAEKTAEGTEQAGKVNNFIEFLNDFSNDLSGKTNPLDRTVQKWIPGGRKTFRVIDWLNKRVKANVILGNASSSIAQIFNVPQGIASAGINNSIKGLGRSLASMFKKNAPQEQSIFLKERYFDAFDKFDKGIVNDTRKFAAWMVGALDEVGSKYIWNSHYEKAIKEGIQNPIKYADDMTRSLVAGRGIGEVPLAQKSKVFQMVAPFQLEVANLWHVMGDMVGEKQFGKLATLFVMNYLFNRVAEKVRGSDVTFDPIQATIEAVQAFAEEEDKGKGLLRASGRIGGEVLSNVPGGQTVAAMYPEYGFSAGDFKAPTRKDFFGKGDPTRFGGGLLVTKGLEDPLFKIAPPFGGQQLKRTIEGVGAVNKGYSESATGRIQYTIDKKPVNYLKGAVFGKSSLDEARSYYDEGRSVLGEKQSEMLKSAETPEEKSGYYGEVIRKRTEDNLYEALKENSSFNPREFDAETQASAYYRYISNLPKEERDTAYARIKPYVTDEISAKIKEIYRLKQMGIGQEDRDLAKIPPQLRGRAIYERIKELKKENRRQKYVQLQRAGIITPEINNYLMNYKP